MALDYIAFSVMISPVCFLLTELDPMISSSCFTMLDLHLRDCLRVLGSVQDWDGIFNTASKKDVQMAPFQLSFTNPSTRLGFKFVILDR